MWSEALVQQLFFHYSTRFYWLNRLNIAIDISQYCRDMSRDISLNDPTFTELTTFYSNTQYLGREQFELTGMTYSKLFKNQFTGSSTWKNSKRIDL